MTPNLTLLSILAVIITLFFGSVWVSKTINDRQDEILTGVVKGVPVSTKYRWIMLFTNWLPFVVFLVAFLFVMALGLLELARGAEDERIRLLGYACAVLPTSGAAFWSILGVIEFSNMLSALRDTTRA
jgi:predicted secreted protein